MSVVDRHVPREGNRSDHRVKARAEGFRPARRKDATTAPNALAAAASNGPGVSSANVNETNR